MPFIAEKTYVGQRAKSVSSAPEFAGYSKVVINIDDEVKIESGTDIGRVLEFTCPWGTQEMADNILRGLRGFQYQPYTATGAIIDPAAEIGDGITANGLYSGIYHYNANLGSLYTSDVSAPCDEEVDHEYPYESYGDRTIVRKFLETRAEFKVQGEEIDARVSQTGGNNHSFGWTLTTDGFILSANDSEVFRADEHGITVTGEIRATSGYIGGEQGFTITDRAIYNGVTGLYDKDHPGVYIGTDGITLGKGAFRVDAAGNLYATSGTFTGAVYAGSIQYGGEAGSFDGYGLTSGTVTGGYGGAIGGSTITTANTNGGINSSLGYADFSNSVFHSWDMASSVWTSTLRIGSSGTQYFPQTISFIDGNGNPRSFNVLGTW